MQSDNLIDFDLSMTSNSHWEQTVRSNFEQSSSTILTGQHLGCRRLTSTNLRGRVDVERVARSGICSEGPLLTGSVKESS